MNSAEKPNSSKNNETSRSDIPEGDSWQNPGEFPNFAGKQQKTNVDRLQALLDRAGFSELKKDDEKFKNFLETTDKQDMHRYLSHINQKLRELSSKDRGFFEGRMAAGELVSPDKNTQTEVLDYTIDMLPQIKDLKYRATCAYYTINNLHMFRDGNGRTARTIFELLSNSDADITKQQHFLSHDNNKSVSGTTENGAYRFEKSKNIISTNDFNQFAMLGYLEKRSSDNDSFISKLKNSLESDINNNDGNTFIIYGGLECYMPGDIDIRALHGNSGYDSLNDEERERVCCSFRYEDARVSTSALAMLAFYDEKGERDSFLERIEEDMGNRKVYIIDIDPGECENWDKKDFLRYAELAESIKEQVLKTGVDIFANPDDYRFLDKNIAEVATNAQEFYKERESSKR